MKKIGLIIIAAALVACQHVAEEPKTVKQCASPSEGRVAACSFAMGDSIYIFGGRTPNGKYSASIMAYDTQSDTWSEERTTPLAGRVHAVACSHKNGAYIGLGYIGKSIHQDESYARDWWHLDAKTQQWTQLSPFPSKRTVAAVAFANEEYIWVGFGFNSFGRELWRYSIADDQWEAVEEQGIWPERLMSSVAATVNGRHFHGTGYRTRGRSDWWEFIETDQRWERRASVPGGGRHNAACSATENACWIVGGWHYGDSLTNGFHFEDILRYTPENDQWTICGTIPCGTTENGVACAIGNTLYFGLGENERTEIHNQWYCIHE